MQNQQNVCSTGESPEKHGENHDLAGMNSASIIRKIDHSSYFLKSFKLADEMETVVTGNNWSWSQQKVRASCGLMRISDIISCDDILKSTSDLLLEFKHSLLDGL